MRKKSEKHPILQIAITAIAIIAVIVHLLWPNLRIDAITIALLLIAIFPWLQPFVKSFELPGGWKIEYQDIQKARDKAEKAGLLNPHHRGSGPGDIHLFELSDKEDPILIFSGLRLEIESKLRELAARVDTRKTDGIIFSVSEGNISDILRLLKTENVLTSDENIALRDIISVLDSGINGAVINQEAIDWALDIGSRIIDWLLYKYSEVQQRKQPIGS